MTCCLGVLSLLIGGICFRTWLPVIELNVNKLVKNVEITDRVDSQRCQRWNSSMRMDSILVKMHHSYLWLLIMNGHVFFNKQYANNLWPCQRLSWLHVRVQMLTNAIPWRFGMTHHIGVWQTPQEHNPMWTIGDLGYTPYLLIDWNLVTLLPLIDSKKQDWVWQGPPFVRLNVHPNQQNLWIVRNLP